ncbi:MAG TPA: hypothetical protein VII01_03800 [Solirubrobacteraceae bacterium]
MAQRHEVLDRIRTSAEVKRARWDEERSKWVLETSAGVATRRLWPTRH